VEPQVRRIVANELARAAEEAGKMERGVGASVGHVPAGGTDSTVVGRVVEGGGERSVGNVLPAGHTAQAADPSELQYDPASHGTQKAE